jgi:asparagine synthase (glutamine-hydrolysing)
MDSNIFHCAEKYFGIEYRHPFFNVELVEFALSLPPEMKYSSRMIKQILRKAMKNVLPEEIKCRKDKAEFSEVLKQQIEAIDIDRLLKQPNIVKLGIITKEDISYRVERYRSGEQKFVSYLWMLINVEYWYVINRFDD